MVMEMLVGDVCVCVVSFIGLMCVGWFVIEIVVKVGICKIVFELGGNVLFIVIEDVDVD